jgi:DNA polymerase III subunit epsilon
LGLLKNEIFVCFDCESTGLDPKQDRLIEVGAVRFTLQEGILDRFDSMVNPGVPIPEASIAIHHITDEMVHEAPAAGEVIPKLIDFVGQAIVIGHGIRFDLDLVTAEAQRAGVNCTLNSRQYVDTLRLARHYGESPTNSLEFLRQHFNIQVQHDAHRALSDAEINMEVFDHLVRRFKTTKQLIEIASKPVLLKRMPLGKHKGRSFTEVPEAYLQWAVRQEFDEDLCYTIRSELKRRRKGGSFSQAGNPFQQL